MVEHLCKYLSNEISSFFEIHNCPNALRFYSKVNRQRHMFVTSSFPGGIHSVTSTKLNRYFLTFERLIYSFGSFATTNVEPL
jgi:hypothetical protein